MSDKPGLWQRIGNQFGSGILRDYLIPVETNNIWYSLGGFLVMSLAFQIFFGFILLYKYIPDAALAFGITQQLINSPTWKIILNFHYWNSFLLIGLIMAHMMRVFITGSYRGAKKGLWLIGVALLGVVFLLALTGESIHWDEVGFAVPWHISESLQAVNLSNFFHYNFADLRNVASATTKLTQLYAVHVALAPILLGVFAGLHLYLVKAKGISTPFWKQASGKKGPFKDHVKIWLIGGAVILVALLLVAAFVPRDAGVAPQNLPTSPLYGSKHGPGALGFKPSFPISWTHGMNVFFSEHLGINPDIWGTMTTMAIFAVIFLAIPFIDRGEEPKNKAETLNLRKRIWAFLAIAIFWALFIIGVVQNAIAGAG